MDRIRTQLFSVLLLLTTALPARAEEAIVAVAANFLTTAETLAEAYRYETGHDIVLAHGSTGRLYAQIKAGAPYDIYLAADTERPDLLVDEGRAAESIVYAVGQLVLVTRTEVQEPAIAIEGRRVALADPAVAPYGAAAVAAIRALGLEDDAYSPVYGDSVGQAASIFATGNADAAFLAASQIPVLGDGVFVMSVETDPDALAQAGVLLPRGAGNPAATGFWAFLASPEGRRIIRDAGYGVPE